MTRALLVGWFSFEGMGATAGDVLAAGVAREWLEESGRTVDTAVVSPFPGEVELVDADPSRYDELVFVCGPFGNGPPIAEMLDTFAHCRLIGIDVSMLQPLAQWNPFDVLYERESDRRAHPDLALASTSTLLPVVGLIEVHPQSEYGPHGRHEQVHRMIGSVLSNLEAVILPIDTRLDVNGTGLRSGAEVESLVARCDLVVTTRLHGMVLALKHGVPAVVVDPIAGGAKVLRQAEVLGWPLVFTPEQVSELGLLSAIRACSTAEMIGAAAKCAMNGRRSLEAVRVELLADLDR